MDRQSILFLVILFVKCSFDTSVAHEANIPGMNNLNTMWNFTVTDQLKHRLLLHYDKFARPTPHNATTTVRVGLRVTHVEVNEFKNTFSVHGSLKMTWKDDKLRWNATEYDGFYTLHVADHEIWQPDIVPYYSGVGSTFDHYGNTHCLVNNDGTVLWVPPIHFIVFCELNFRYWPFDTQNCAVKLASWTHHGNMIHVELDKTFPQVTDLIIKNSEWELIGWSVQMKLNKYKCCPEPYPEVSFNFTVHRKSPTYKAVIFTPTFTMITITLVAFLLPPEAGEKLALNFCATLISLMFLLYFSQKCQVMGDHTPLIVMFYSSSLYVVSFCTMISVAVIWISRTDHQVELPWFIKQALTGWFGKSLGLSNYIQQTTACRSRVTVSRDSVAYGNDLTLGLDLAGDGSNEECRINPSVPHPHRVSNTRRQDWMLFAAALDRLFFMFYLLVFAILAANYFSEYDMEKGKKRIFIH